METVKQYILRTKLESSLLILQSQYSSEIQEALRHAIVGYRHLSSEEMYIRIEEQLKICKKKHRCRIFRMMKSGDFIKEFPKMKRIAKLDMSDMKKAVLLMLSYGCLPSTITKVLSSSSHSIMTMISELRGRLQH